VPLSKPIEKDLIIVKLRQYFKDKEDASLVFIFGSIVSGHITEQSDVDIAVLFSHKPKFQEILNTTDEVCRAIGREIDLVVLNDSSPIIRMQVLKNGKLIKSKSHAVYNDFFIKALKEYDDLKYIRREAEKNILKGRIYA
jgi:predicted nucleotidyltransferase